MKVAFSGASGFVGTHLRDRFTNHTIINRNDTQEDIVRKLQDVDVVINLAGAPIIKRWDDKYKKILINSRINTTKKIVDAINQTTVKLFISTSAIGAYPDNNPFDESYKNYHNDFLGSLTKAWEDEASRCEKPTAIVRFGIILGTDGGALKQMLLPFKMGIGGNIGNGEMFMSWIDIDDLVRAYSYIIENSLDGVFNFVSPNPVRNKEFTKALGTVLKRPTIFPLPEFVLKIIYGEASTVLTGSKEIYPKSLLDNGFEFKYTDIKSSLEHLFKDNS